MEARTAVAGVCHLLNAEGVTGLSPEVLRRGKLNRGEVVRPLSTAPSGTANDALPPSSVSGRSGHATAVEGAYGAAGDASSLLTEKDPERCAEFARLVASLLRYPGEALLSASDGGGSAHLVMLLGWLLAYDGLLDKLRCRQSGGRAARLREEGEVPLPPFPVDTLHLHARDAAAGAGAAVEHCAAKADAVIGGPRAGDLATVANSLLLDFGRSVHALKSLKTELAHRAALHRRVRVGQQALVSGDMPLSAYELWLLSDRRLVDAHTSAIETRLDEAGVAEKKPVLPPEAALVFFDWLESVVTKNSIHLGGTDDAAAEDEASDEVGGGGGTEEREAEAATWVKVEVHKLKKLLHQLTAAVDAKASDFAKVKRWWEKARGFVSDADFVEISRTLQPVASLIKAEFAPASCAAPEAASIAASVCKSLSPDVHARLVSAQDQSRAASSVPPPTGTGSAEALPAPEASPATGRIDSDVGAESHVHSGSSAQVEALRRELRLLTQAQQLDLAAMLAPVVDTGAYSVHGLS